MTSFYLQPAFFIAVVLLASLFQLVGARARSLLLIIASIAVLRLALSWEVLGCLLGVIAWLLIGVRITRPLAARSPMAATLVTFLPVGALWIAGKQAALPSWLVFVGLSYLVVKAWTFVKDIHDGRIERWDPLTAAAYFLYFPTFVCGPMHLYDEFAAAVATLEAPYAGRLVDIIRRALLGLVKVVVLAPLLRPYSLLHWRDLASVPPRLLLPASCVYSAILFFDFSGYTDLAIACSRLVGIAAPENFRAPFLAPDPREFWQRWHMSFTRVLTGYVFVPLSRALSRRLRDERAIKVLAYGATFALCGYWHGSTPRFVWWGLYHALGLIVFDLFFRRRRNASWLAKSVAVTVTFLFVSLGWTLFALPGRS